MKYKVGEKLLCVKSKYFDEGRAYTIERYCKETRYEHENILFHGSGFLFVPIYHECKFTHLTNLTKLLYLD